MYIVSMQANDQVCTEIINFYKIGGSDINSVYICLFLGKRSCIAVHLDNMQSSWR